MSARKLIVFKHASELGNAPANQLFDLVKVEKTGDAVARCFTDYKVTTDKGSLPENVTIEELL
jgi:CRISPR-associated protein Csd2